MKLYMMKETKVLNTYRHNIGFDSLAIIHNIIVMAATLLTSENQNLETYSLLWLDAEVNSSQENVKTQQQLRASINQLRTFEDDHECEEYIRLVPKEDRIILIVSSQLGEQVVPRIHQLQQVFSIYVYCINTEKYKQ